MSLYENLKAIECGKKRESVNDLPFARRSYLRYCSYTTAISASRRWGGRNRDLRQPHSTETTCDAVGPYHSEVDLSG